MKWYLNRQAVPLAAALFLVAAHAQDRALVICDQPYALCTSAPCVPDPDDPEKQAICTCQVKQGLSLGTESCSARPVTTLRVAFAPAPTVTVGQPKRPLAATTTQLVASTFSFDQLLQSQEPGGEPKKIMFCPSGNPWTYCLDSPCTVDPRNPQRAICRCQINWGGRFLTMGGGCDTDTCKDSYWSGARTNDMEQASAKFNTVLADPVQWREHVCPGQKP